MDAEARETACTRIYGAVLLWDFFMSETLRGINSASAECDPYQNWMLARERQGSERERERE